MSIHNPDFATTPGLGLPGKHVDCFFTDCNDCTEPCKPHSLPQWWEQVLEGHICNKGCYDGIK